MYVHFLKIFLNKVFAQWILKTVYEECNWVPQTHTLFLQKGGPDSLVLKVTRTVPQMVSKQKDRVNISSVYHHVLCSTM